MGYSRQALDITKCACCGEEFMPNRSFQRFINKDHQKRYYEMVYEAGVRAVEAQIKACCNDIPPGGME